MPGKVTIGYSELGATQESVQLLAGGLGSVIVSHATSEFLSWVTITFDTDEARRIFDNKRAGKVLLEMGTDGRLRSAPGVVSDVPVISHACTTASIPTNHKSVEVV